METTLSQYLLVSGALFAIGLLGVIVRRNLLIIYMSLELMLNAANVALVAMSRFNGNLDGQVMVFFIITVAAAEVSVGLALIVALYQETSNRRRGGLGHDETVNDEHRCMAHLVASAALGGGHRFGRVSLVQGQRGDLRWRGRRFVFADVAADCCRRWQVASERYLARDRRGWRSTSVCRSTVSAS